LLVDEGSLKTVSKSDNSVISVSGGGGGEEGEEGEEEEESSV
jgi:hypothetical protein